MGTVFAPTCPNITVGYHEIKLTDLNWIELQPRPQAILRGKLEKIPRWLWNTFKDREIIKWDDLLTILHFANNDIQLSMELNDNKLPFLDTLMTKSGKKNG